MALFPGFGGGAGKLGKSALGTRLNTTYLEIMIPSCPLTARQICFARFFCRQVNGFSEALVDLASSSRDLVLARLQNSPYFCVFKYARAGKQKVWNEAENRERDWGETPHTPVGRVRLARFARVRLLRHALPISLLILRKKTTVLQSMF